MATVTVHEAKTKLSELLRRVEAGEEIIIARGYVPVASLVALTHDAKGQDIERRRRAGMGCMAGQYAPVPDSIFFEPMSDEELALWYGGDDELLK